MKKTLYIVLAVICLMIGNAFAQESPESSEDQNYNEQGDFLDLTGSAIRIERKVQMPRVSIFDKRIKPDFDHIALDKSFNKEIAGKNEEMKFKLNDKLIVMPIKNIESLIKKNR